MADKGYRFLKMSRKVFTVLAWLALAIGLVSGVIIFINRQGPWEPRLTATALALIFGVFYFFVFGTVSELIRLLLDIESKVKS